MIEQLFRFAVGHVQLAVAAALGLVVLAIFLRWERRGRSVAVVLTILGVLVLDAALFPSTEAKQLASIFHPSLAGQGFRLVQLLIGVGLLARLLARGWPARAGVGTALWLMFFAWYATAGVVGLIEGNALPLVVSRGMLVLEAGGMLALAAGVPVRDYLDERGLPRFIRWAGLLAAVNFALAELDVRITSTSVPRLPLLQVGEMGSDAATLFAALGLIGAAMELGRPRRRPMVVAASAALLIAHLASPQRAARVGIVVTLVVFLVVVVWPRRRRFRARGGDWVLAGLCLAAFVAAPIFYHSAAGHDPPSLAEAVPFSDLTEQAVNTDYRQGSVQSRYIAWDAVEPLIRERPLFGHGLGETYVHYDVGVGGFVESDLVNNVALDLLYRTGVVGLVLFVVALAGTCVTAWSAWRHARSDVVALLAAMTLAVLAGLLAKGMVESVLNEYHLTPLFGFLLGFAGALAAAARSDPYSAPPRLPTVGVGLGNYPGPAGNP